MNVTRHRIEEVLKTLPTNYYLGKSISVKISEDADTSYFAPDTFCVVISTHNVIDSIKNPETLTEEELEKFIRNPLYHELSHALRTPKVLLKYCTAATKDMVNIAEDERIETLGEGYFLNTNFKEACKLINDYDPTKTTFRDAEEAWFYLWRFRHSPRADWLKKVNVIIEKYKNLRFDKNDDFCICPKSGGYIRVPRPLEYYRELYNFWEEFKKEYNEPPVIIDVPIDIDGSGDVDDNPGIKNDPDERDRTKDKEKKVAKKVIADADLHSILDTYHSTSLVTKLEKIILSSKRKRGLYSSAISKYSGTFDIRSVMANKKDYKWWVTAAKQGSQNRYGKIKLNLFVDVSGSFGSSEDKINQIITSLGIIERANRDFSFDVVHVGKGCKLTKPGKRSVECYGGNDLDETIVPIFKSIQERDAVNYNILVADGDLWSDSLTAKRSYYKKVSMSLFDAPNCIIISDPANEIPINIYAKKAKRIITRDYVNQLEENVVKTLGQLIQ